jgi:hypothetical protein
MKKLTTLLILISLSSFAQEQELVQTGTPAMLEAANGKKMKVFLQSLENESLTFQPFKSSKNMSVPSSKIKSLEFFPKYDEAGLEVSFNAGDYTAVCSMLDPLMVDFEQYMSIENNLYSVFVLHLKARLGLGEYEKVQTAADAMISNTFDYRQAMKGRVYKALAAIAEGDFDTAEKQRADIESEAALLYLNACTQRAKGQPKEAMQTVIDIIAEHGNDVEWLGPGELLSANLYLDMALTNSALNTARQVKNMYAGSHIGGDGAKLYEQLQTAENQTANEHE